MPEIHIHTNMHALLFKCILELFSINVKMKTKIEKKLTRSSNGNKKSELKPKTNNIIFKLQEKR